MGDNTRGPKDHVNIRILETMASKHARKPEAMKQAIKSKQASSKQANKGTKKQEGK